MNQSELFDVRVPSRQLRAICNSVVRLLTVLTMTIACVKAEI